MAPNVPSLNITCSLSPNGAAPWKKEHAHVVRFKRTQAPTDKSEREMSFNTKFSATEHAEL